MDPFKELGILAARLSDEGEFPTWLLRDVMVLADDPEQYADKAHEIRTLIAQIGNFDPYAGVGCFEFSVSAESIGATIRRIMKAGQ